MRNNRWLLILFLALCGAINYTDRAAFGLAAPQFTSEFGIDAAMMGWLGGAFSIGYALFNFVGGWSSDRFGAKRVFGFALLFWSLFCGSIGLTAGIATMFLARMMFGAAEGPFSSLVNKFISNWFPAEEAATAVGLGNAGNPLGAAAAGPIVGGLLAAGFGWRLPFFIFAALGLVLAALWWRFAQETPATGPTRKAALVNHEGPKLPFSYYIRLPSILATAFAFFAINYILYFFITWFPSYLVSAHHLSFKDMGYVSMIPWLLGAVGLAAGGYITDFAARHLPLMMSRKLVLGGFLGLSALCIGIAGTVTDLYTAVALMSFAVLFMYLAAPAPWVIVQDLVAPELVGSVSGFNHMLSNLGGFFGPLLTGLLVQATGTFGAAFMLAGGVGIVAVIGVIIFLSPPRAEPTPAATLATR